MLLRAGQSELYFGRGFDEVKPAVTLTVWVVSEEVVLERFEGEGGSVAEAIDMVNVAVVELSATMGSGDVL